MGEFQMLFSACNCQPTSSSVSRRDLICGAGVGFVSALVSTLAGSGRTAHAQVLGSRVAEVDRLAVTIVTDTQIIKFIPTEKRNDLTIERRPAGNIRPDSRPRTDLVGEWGLSMHAQSQRGSDMRNVLIDFGYMPETINNNFSVLNLDPAEIDALVLSHGHYDHFGGLTGFLAANKGKLKHKLPFFVGGEDCFCTRETPAGQYGALDRKAIMDADLELMLAEGPAVVAEHAFTTGKVAQTSFEKPLRPSSKKIGIVNGFGCFPDKVAPEKNTGTFIPDDFEHEIATNYLLKGKGLVVLTSCSHRGVINTIISDRRNGRRPGAYLERPGHRLRARARSCASAPSHT
jgi:7,8-dihydropterin-6-yl-methyl-4-(beta-D-ribofuranosyl)aminobenzene 5'-phosphate synthase